MDANAIRKSRTTANLTDYPRTRAEFTWDRARPGLAGLPDGRGLNIAHEAVDRHVLSGRGGHVALRCRDRAGHEEDGSYGDLRVLTNQFANVLRGLGIGRGDRVANLGDLGVESVFGVIFPPQVALVGFGKVTDRPWAAGGMLGVRPVVTVTLSADHRASDGYTGGQLLDLIGQLLNHPEEL
ncbi:hypothetical protein GCM10029964_056350 [Kibdelosporangium lantanae]